VPGLGYPVEGDATCGRFLAFALHYRLLHAGCDLRAELGGSLDFPRD
jgi:hypothetical protein